MSRNVFSIVLILMQSLVFSCRTPSTNDSVSPSAEPLNVDERIYGVWQFDQTSTEVDSNGVKSKGFVEFSDQITISFGSITFTRVCQLGDTKLTVSETSAAVITGDKFTIKDKLYKKESVGSFSCIVDLPVSMSLRYILINDTILEIKSPDDENSTQRAKKL
jgi:hypothetical protein